MAIITVEAFQCNRCTHIWISKKFTRKNPPLCCSKCKTPSWDRKVEEEEDDGGARKK